jgi:Outer membrane protein beta-barrel family
MLNYFKGKKKISVYGIASNTGLTGLGWDDRSKFGEGSDFGDAEVEVGAGFIMINSSGSDNDFNDWENSYRNEGLPKAVKAGAHVSNKWNADKQSINSNYTLKKLDVDAEGNSLTKTFFKDSAIYSNESHTSVTSQTQHLFNGTYDLKLDSLSSLRLKFNGKIQTEENYTSTHTETDNQDFQKLNTNGRTNAFNSDNKIFLGSFLWRQKFNRKGRTLSLSASYKNADNYSDGFLNSGTELFSNGTLFRTDSINQYKTNSSITSTANSKLVYTEPAGKKGILEFNYTINNVTSNSNRKSFDKVNDKYESLNPLFSNKYQLTYLSNSAGVKFQYNGKKITANIGSNAGVSHYAQKDSLGREVRQFNYTNLFPTARISYRFAPQRAISVNYSGSPQAPAIDQVQPIVENTNPLYKTIGNPSLRQAFRHDLSFFFNDFKTLTGRSIWINGSLNSTHDAIVSNQTVVNGITTTQYVNASGNYNYWFYGSYNIKIRKTNMYAGLSTTANGSRYVNFLNGERNFSHQRTIGSGFNIEDYKEDKFDFWLRTNFEYTVSVSAKNKLVNENHSKTNYWSQTHNAGINLHFKKRLDIGTDADFTFKQKTDVFANNNVFTIWNANIAYKVFKKRNGIFKFEINDILKQKRGYERSSFYNSISEKYYNTLGRYAMLSFSWNFTKNPGAPTPTK